MAFTKPTEEDESRGTSVEAGRKTNAIKVNQQPELIENKDLKGGRREGGRTAAFTDAQAEWENSAIADIFLPHGCSQEHKTTDCISSV